MAASQADERLLAQLRDRVGQRVTGWRPGARVRGVSPLTGGTSSLTFLVDLAGVAAGETPVVLKVAPPGLAPVRNRDVLRQARLQKAVQGAGRPLAPDVLFADPGEPPEVPPFMAMNLVPGECVEPVLCDAAMRPAPGQVRARFFDAVQVLAQLHAIDPAAAGLGGEPAVGLADEVDRWTRAFATLPKEMGGDYERAAKALRSSMPAPLPTAVNHGDFRLGNTLCEGDQINAVIDWEIWSVGDPRIDLGWFLVNSDADTYSRPSTFVDAVPPRSDLLSCYGDVSEVAWFMALACFKSAATWALIVKHNRRRSTPQPQLEAMAPVLPGLLERSRVLMG